MTTSRQRERGEIPKTLAECDRELNEYRKAMRLVSREGRFAVWDQIDRVLEIRFLLQTSEVRRSQR